MTLPAADLWRPPCNRYAMSGFMDYYTCAGHDPVLKADCAKCVHGQQQAPQVKRQTTEEETMARVGFWKQAAGVNYGPGRTRLEVALEMIAGGKSVAETERLFGAAPNSIYGYLPKKGEAKQPAPKPADTTPPPAEKPAFADNWQASIDELAAKVAEQQQRIGDLEADNAALQRQRDGAQAEVAILKGRDETGDEFAGDAQAELDILREFVRYMSLGEQVELFEAGVNFARRTVAA